MKKSKRITKALQEAFPFIDPKIAKAMILEGIQNAESKTSCEFKLFIAFRSVPYLLYKALPKKNKATRNMLMKNVGSCAKSQLRKLVAGKTKEKNGILFYFSLQEKMFYVIADKAIYHVLTQKRLDEYAESIATGMREQKGLSFITSTMNEMTKVLAPHFPHAKNDINEIPDSIEVG